MRLRLPPPPASFAARPAGDVAGRAAPMARFIAVGAIHLAAVAMAVASADAPTPAGPALITVQWVDEAAVAAPPVARPAESAPARPVAAAAPVAVQPPPPTPIPARTDDGEASEAAARAAITATPATSAAPVNAVAMAAAAAPASAAAAAPPTAPLVDPRFDADYLRNPPPSYPPLARRLGEEGRVLLRVEVGTDGRAQRVETLTGSGSPRLDAAAIDAVRRWRFEPARLGSSPVAAWVRVPINFRLHEKS